MSDVKNKQNDRTDNDFTLKAKGKDLRPTGDNLDTEGARKADAQKAADAVSLPAGRKYVSSTDSYVNGVYVVAGDVITLAEGQKPNKAWRSLNEGEAKSVVVAGGVAPSSTIGTPVNKDESPV